MTREEAIEMLKKDKEQRGNCFISDALDMAIKALEQEPCEDAISRQAVLEEMEERHKEGDCITKGFINKLPPVTPQPKTGHWMLTSDDDCEYCTCSECGYQNGENWMIGSQIKFCQECGAKMVEPQEREE